MPTRPGTNWTVDDLDYIGRPREERYDSWGTAEIITQYKEGISVGQSMDGISNLGHLHRQLLQESDFHAVGRTLLKKLRPEEENEKFGFNGSKLPDKLKAILLALDKAEIESSTLKSTIRLAKEDTETLEWITENWETFVETPAEDALSKADGELNDCEDTGDYLEVNEKRDQGSSPSRDSYRVVEVFKKSFFKEAAERRLVHLKHRLHTIQACTFPQEVEQTLWSIRKDYEDDRKLLELWNQKQKAEDRKAYLTSLHKQREKLEALRELGKTDEVLDFESIRAKMWFCFDRERKEKTTEAEVERPLNSRWTSCCDPKTGKITEEGYMTEEECLELIAKGKPDPRKFVAERVVTPASLWEMQKSKDFCYLNQTRSQWNRVYEYIWKKMNETIISRLYSMKKAEEGLVLAEYIRRFQFRLDSEQLGKVILEKAQKVQTENGKNLIRMLLAGYQYQLDKKTTKEIVRELSKKRI